MSKDHARIYSKHTKNTVFLLGLVIAKARKEQGLSETAVAKKNKCFQEHGSTS